MRQVIQNFKTGRLSIVILHKNPNSTPAAVSLRASALSAGDPGVASAFAFGAPAFLPIDATAALAWD